MLETKLSPLEEQPNSYPLNHILGPDTLLLMCVLENGLNALHLAAKEGHVGLVQELLGRGSSVDSATKLLEPVLELALVDQAGLKLTEIYLLLPPECEIEDVHQHAQLRFTFNPIMELYNFLEKKRFLKEGDGVPCEWIVALSDPVADGVSLSGSWLSVI
ncbi:hypothetical protein U0070_005844 [Myodes glareolus]|uniref:Uncharacterized protein n=1 Tax=Myodes glareolus TaxID=447135 RepID=A0AAW0IK50_MYOGA